MAIPNRLLAVIYVRLHLALLGSLLPCEPLAEGVRLRLLSSSVPPVRPWQIDLVAERAGNVLQSSPIDLRSLCYLPCAAFVALGAATPLGGWRRNAKLIVFGLPCLHALLLVLLSTPLLSFFGGTGPLSLFRLAPVTHVALQIIYRALVAPPGMVFALPLLLWAALVGLRGAPAAPP